MNPGLVKRQADDAITHINDVMGRSLLLLMKQADEAISQRDQLREVLMDVAVYLEDKADYVDGPESAQMPNTAMQLWREVERVLAQVKN